MESKTKQKQKQKKIKEMNKNIRVVHASGRPCRRQAIAR